MTDTAHPPTSSATPTPMPMPTPADRHQQAADALWVARQTRQPIPPLRGHLDPTDLAGAYAVQQLNDRRARAAGARRIGRKIGLTSLAVQAQLGVDQPDFGCLYDHMLFTGPRASLPHGRLIQPKIEGEIAFRLAEDITQADLSPGTLRRCAGQAMAAFEVVDSAIADWKITLADTVADNASCGALVLGTAARSLADVEPRAAEMVMFEDGVAVSRGTGAASLGDPLAAFAWLANRCVALGDPLRAGEVVLTGALGPMVVMHPGRRYRLQITGFDAVEAVLQAPPA